MSLINTAYAATTSGSGSASHGPSMAPMLIVLAIIVVFYFWMWRQQNKKTKKHQSVVNSLSKGDEIITTGGIAGRVKGVDESYITLEIAKDTNILVQKPAVSSVLPKGTVKTLDKAQ